MALVERLKLIQQAHRWDDAEMARRCGLSMRMWQQVRAGTTRLGHRALRAILQGFPEVGPEVLSYLAEPTAEAVA